MKSEKFATAAVSQLVAYSRGSNFFTFHFSFLVVIFVPFAPGKVRAHLTLFIFFCARLSLALS